jgi:hypothetical protein
MQNASASNSRVLLYNLPQLVLFSPMMDQAAPVGQFNHENNAKLPSIDIHSVNGSASRQKGAKPTDCDTDMTDFE